MDLSSGMARLFRQRGRERAHTQRHEREWQSDSLRQGLNSLRARYRLASTRLPQAQADQKKKIIEEIERILNPTEPGTLSWRDADYCEQLLCFILSDAQLDGELESVLSRAEEQKLASAAARRAQFVALTANPAPARAEEGKQVLLHATLYELQELRRRASQIRGMRLDAVFFVTWVSMVAMLFVGLPLFIYLFHLATHENGVSSVSKLVMAFPNFGLFTAVSFGALGALFSRFIILQKSELGVSLDEAATYYSGSYIMLRVLVGTVGAIIVYFFLGSGLVEGNLVPNIRTLSYVPAYIEIEDKRGPIQTYLGTPTTVAMVPSVDMALLIVWAFLAGFSEQLVPSLLDETARRVQTRNNQASSPAPTPQPSAPPSGKANQGNGGPPPPDDDGNAGEPANGEPK
jgi:hypothetical protein